MAFLVFVECVDVADGETVVDTREIFDFHEGVGSVEGLASDMELVEFLRLH